MLVTNSVSLFCFRDVKRRTEVEVKMCVLVVVVEKGGGGGGGGGKVSTLSNSGGLTGVEEESGY